MLSTVKSGRFEPGRLVATLPVLGAVPKEEILAAYCRHLSCDWGNAVACDWKRNDEAVQNGGRLFSEYKAVSGQIFWIFTEEDRSATTVLLPEDYQE